MPVGEHTMRATSRRAALLLALGTLVPLLAACSKPVGSTSVHNVAWVATGASVTLPGTGVTPVTLATRHVAPKVTVGSLPSALAYTPGGKGLLVVTQGDDMLHEIDTATHDVEHSAVVGVEPDAVAVAPGGKDGKGIALVANLDSGTVTPVDLATWHAGTPVTVGTQPVAIAVVASPTGTATAFVANFGSNTVTPINTATMQAGKPIAVGPEPQTVAAASGEVLVGNFGNQTLTPINPATLTAGAPAPLPLNPTGMAVAPSGSTVYVCGGASIVSVSTLGLVAGTPVHLPDAAQGIALSEDGSTAWVTQQAGSIVGVTLATGQVGRPIHLGGHPSAIVIGTG